MAEIINITDNPETVKIFLQANDDLASLLWLGDFTEAAGYVREFYERHRRTIRDAIEIGKQITDKRKEIYADAKERVLKEIENEATDEVIKSRIDVIFDEQFSEYISGLSSKEISLFTLAPICRKINKIHRKLSNYQSSDLQRELFGREQSNIEILESLSRYTISYLDKDESQLHIKANSLDGRDIDVDEFVEELSVLLNYPTSNARIVDFTKQEFPLWYRFFSDEGYLETVFYSRRRFTVNAIFFNQNDTKKLLKKVLRILNRY